MDATTRDIGDSTIITITGKITIAAGDAQLRDIIEQQRKRGRKKILLDLSGVTTIDSSGLAELIGSNTSMVNAGGRLVLTGLSSKLNELLHVTQLVTVFETADETQDALALLHRP